jgi:hypothetical protein
MACKHGKGLNCRICYDQTYGLDWHNPGCNCISCNTAKLKVFSIVKQEIFTSPICNEPFITAEK